ncbi:RCC1/BLIP-II [Eremomyces bilateralis CBS 781.70]|uniref:RCC1/BLIP-II n=1 Tax=Eremomyces bilateralis CBS 781.70 TaxID=1392243 RepID=A0A6G1FTA4_9PEZI|nr:RCC1/BLIP-II [Eremomyces bilateralis CBS 781.70]KAF1809105.1 RCC1/BLIP-II [Eremomyces bilateralis CBS 781.70]
METILACGQNWFHQLDDSPSTFITHFKPLSNLPISGSSTVRVLHAGWSSSVFAVDGLNSKVPLKVCRGKVPLPDVSHNGPISSITPESHRFRRSQSMSLQCIDCGLAGDNSTSANLFQAALQGAFGQSDLPADIDSDHVFHMACTAANRVAILTHQSHGRLIVLEYEVGVSVGNGSSCSTTFQKVLATEVQGEKAYLYSGNTFFLLGVNNSQVYSWGDARFRKCLGRDISSAAADKLGPVPLPFTPKKFSVGGYVAAALSQGGRLIIWGQPRPGHETAGLPGVEGDAEDFADVSMPGNALVEDFDIGNDHLAVLTRDGRVFTAGAGECGQLGIGAQLDWQQSLVEVSELSTKRIREVRCGYASTFAISKLEQCAEQF